MSIEKRAHNFDDKTGRRYGKLTVLGLHKIETLSSGKKRSLWLCKCDSVPKSVKKSEYGHGEFVYNGIDRVDNSVGYTIDNCVSCCGMCNFMKRSYNQLDFINQAIKISNKWSKNENK